MISPSITRVVSIPRSQRSSLSLYYTAVRSITSTTSNNKQLKKRNSTTTNTTSNTPIKPPFATPRIPECASDYGWHTLKRTYIH